MYTTIFESIKLLSEQTYEKLWKKVENAEETKENLKPTPQNSLHPETPIHLKP